MHWWKFRALFAALSKETLFVEVMNCRATKITKSMSDSQKRYYKHMKRCYELPQPEEEEARMDAVTEALKRGDAIALENLLR